MCVSSIWMIQSTGRRLSVWLIDCNPKEMEALICCPRRCCWCESHPLLNSKWSLRRRNVWDNHLIIRNYGGIYLFSRSSSWCYPKPRTEFRYWNIQWSLDLLGDTGSIRPELESMRRGEEELWFDRSVWYFDTIDVLIMIQREKGFIPLSLWGEL